MHLVDGFANKSNLVPEEISRFDEARVMMEGKKVANAYVKYLEIHGNRTVCID